jgi:hypothetical protein
MSKAHANHKKCRERPLDLLPRQFVVQPSSSVSPMTLGSCKRNALQFGNLSQRQPGVVAKPYQVGFFGGFLLQFRKRLVDGQQGFGRRAGRRKGGVQVDSNPVAAVSAWLDRSESAASPRQPPQRNGRVSPSVALPRRPPTAGTLRRPAPSHPMSAPVSRWPT